jgi:hypothetical protein
MKKPGFTNVIRYAAFFQTVAFIDKKSRGHRIADANEWSQGRRHAEAKDSFVSAFLKNRIQDL